MRKFGLGLSFIRFTLLGIVGTCGAGALALACSAAATNATDTGRDAAGGTDGRPNNDDGGGSSGDGGGGEGSAGTGALLSLILVTQITSGSNTSAGVSARFYSSPVVPAGCTKSMVAGGCLATFCPAGAKGVPHSSLNAGAITVTGTGPSSSATLTFGPNPNAPGINDYAVVKQQTRFYTDGDTLSVSGAGGADLPAFAAQTIVTPNDLVLTAPACAAGKCADVSRSTDATLAWTSGGAGKVRVTYFTSSNAGSKTLSCSFDALAGTGTVPAAALMMLDPGSGIESINSTNFTTFMVGTLPTAFEAQGTGVQGTFTASN